MSIWKGLGKVLKVAAPLALPFIPGVGKLLGGLAGSLGSAPGPQQLGSGAYDLGEGTQASPFEVRGATDRGGGSYSWIPPAMSAIGALGSGGLSYAGQAQANASNAQQARAQMDFQASQNANAMTFSSNQADKQMAFQREQSGTAYQRAAADMKAAGLNPMLGYSQGGAQAMSGSAPSGVSSGGAQAQMHNALGSGVASAIQGATAAAGLQQVMAQTENVNAQTANTRSQTLLNALIGDKTIADTHSASAAAANARAALEGIIADSLVREGTGSSRIREAKAGASEAEATAQREHYRLTQERNTSEAMSGRFGQALPYVTPALEALTGAGKTVATARRLSRGW
ncbi:MAG: DNA pilot protein [Microvirus sp.]|nr:MAG: DNA pilot protein [Microvirus sp.]